MGAENAGAGTELVTEKMTITNRSKVGSCPNVSPTAFWDVDFDALNFESDSLFVMNKVFNYGLWSDILAVLRYYGLERVKREIVQAAYLKNTALSFLCVILDLKESDFSVYQQRQQRKPVWKH